MGPYSVTIRPEGQILVDFSARSADLSIHIQWHSRDTPELNIHIQWSAYPENSECEYRGRAIFVLGPQARRSNRRQRRSPPPPRSCGSRASRGDPRMPACPAALPPGLRLSLRAGHDFRGKRSCLHSRALARAR